MSFLINEHQKIMYKHLKHISYYLIHFCGQVEIKLQEII